MNILLVVNKTLNRGQTEALDCSYYNFYIPLLELGHNVYFFDTRNDFNKDFKKIVNEFKPDLIFCLLTGNKNITPYEPIDDISKITKEDKIKTFNWFCDDTWRFESFSSKICNHFSYCSTPEIEYLQKYKDINYNNILLGNWHCNQDLSIRSPKEFNICFCGGITSSRANIFNYFYSKSIDIKHFYGIAYEDIFKNYASAKIGLNLTINDNDTNRNKQMKLRIFEVTASATFLLREYVNGIEEFFEVGKEIETFKSIEEAEDKIKFYLDNDFLREKIALAGHERFLKDHTSRKRLDSIIKQIFK